MPRTTHSHRSKLSCDGRLFELEAISVSSPVTIKQAISIVTERASPPWRLSDLAKAYQSSTLSCRSLLANVEGARLYKSLVAGMGNYFYNADSPTDILDVRWKLQVLGLAAQAPFQAWLLAWQDNDRAGSWHPDVLLPGQTETSSYVQLVTGLHDVSTLQVVGLGSDGLAYLVAWQNESGSWTSGPAAPIGGHVVRFRQLVTGLGNSRYLQVVGLGEDGLAYLAAWLDESGSWHEGIPLPGQSRRFSELSVGYQPTKDVSERMTAPNLQVIGLGQENGLAYQVAWQDESGVWHPGGILPAQGTGFSQLVVVSGGDRLQVIGLGREDGFAYLAGWQDADGNWHSGGPLPAQQTAYSRLFVAQYGQIGPGSGPGVFGLGAGDGLAYGVALQNADGSWREGAILPCQKWFAELLIELEQTGQFPGHWP